ncbi:AraC family transcriptional regulator [Erythrobacter sp. SCSIO 43205]|uniref:helix-turn-helix domain-containing protein n=1 Tax=Erythrobacter sp. SCSIO 43205 TaxID=2779361 RepID=UPI001CA9FC8D|nr:helix-turn-helix domain-containing protein [Erythrobacter sp. SCSIO 43205]UAB79536.1 AraC family transcriptional regulator [Erythrobacter sp. SCSIO 43205]
MIEQWDYLIRLISMGSGLTLLAMVVASEVRLSVRVPLIGMLVGVTGYMLNSKPLWSPTGFLEPWVHLVALSTPFWIWLFGRRLFEREPDRRIILAVVAVMMVGWFLRSFVAEYTEHVGFVLLHTVAFVLVADLVRVGIFERDDDLVEERRIVRLWLPLLVAIQAGQIILVEMLELVSAIDSRNPLMSMLNSLIILLIMLFAGLALFRTNRDLLPKQGEETRANPQDELIPDLDLSPQEKVLHDKLMGAMEDGTYKSPGLTIAKLSEELDVPEHRLRALINRRLGHRNFSAFLNRYRIAEAKGMLASSDHVDLPILTIAMDLGYNSLPPFNRAFRQETGKSPSEYRKLAFVDEPPEPPASAADQN